jgi:hypothetical protein
MKTKVLILLSILFSNLHAQAQTNNSVAGGCLAAGIGAAGVKLMLDLCRKIPSTNAPVPAPIPITWPFPATLTNEPVATILVIYIRGIFATPNRLERDPVQSVDISASGYRDFSGNPYTIMTWVGIQSSPDLVRWHTDLAITNWWSSTNCLSGYYSNGVPIASTYSWSGTNNVPFDFGTGREQTRYFRLISL